MKRDEFIERIREGINHGMWIADQIDEKEGPTVKKMKEWMSRRIVEMLDTMTLLDIIEVSELRELNRSGKSYLYGDLWRWYPEELEKREAELKRKGGQAPEVSSAVDNDDERQTHSSLLSIPQEEENGKLYRHQKNGENGNKGPDTAQ